MHPTAEVAARHEPAHPTSAGARHEPAHPPAEVAARNEPAHPTSESARNEPAHRIDGGGRHELYLMRDDIRATMTELRDRGAEFTRPIAEERWGLITAIRLPGGGELGLYEPRHPTPPHHPSPPR